jgi:hypothetical protein
MTLDSPEYLNLLYDIQDDNKPSLATLLPGKNNVYNIDLSARKIEAPEYLSIQDDHRSEVVYFKCPRYFDTIDLSQLVCIIQYINAAGEGRVYAVPHYDVDTFSGTNEMIFPWVIEGEATKAAGDVQYSIRFYLLERNQINKKLMYNLSTLAATSKVMVGIDVDPEDWETNDKEFHASYLEQILEVAKEIADKDIYWITL